MSEDNTERRIEIIQLKAALDANTDQTEKIYDLLSGQHVLVAEHEVTKSEVKSLKKFKWYDRGLAIVSGVVGGWLAQLGLRQ